jgi:hypothetical protein
MSMLDFNLVMDLHNHTIWSDGSDKPEDIILNAINHEVAKLLNLGANNIL